MNPPAWHRQQSRLAVAPADSVISFKTLVTQVIIYNICSEELIMACHSKKRACANIWYTSANKCIHKYILHWRRCRARHVESLATKAP